MLTSCWPDGTSTGVGSLPGTDPLTAARLAFDTVSLPFLPELPERGPGADLIGRGSGLLSGLHVDLQPGGWRLVARPGLDARRTGDLLQWDMDAFAQAGDGWAGSVKVQVCGPWTLAAGLEMSRGGQALADAGAVRDLAASLAEGVSDHVSEVKRRLPAITQVFVQLDEPSLPAVLAGRIPTASGFGTLRRPEAAEVLAALQTVLQGVGAAATVGVHCCSPAAPARLLQQAGARFLSLDVAGLVPSSWDEEVGEAIEAGCALVAGAVVSDGSQRLPVKQVAAPVRALWGRLGFAADDLRLVAVSPTCGLPKLSLEGAKAALTLAVETAEELAGG